MRIYESQLRTVAMEDDTQGISYSTPPIGVVVPTDDEQ